MTTPTQHDPSVFTFSETYLNVYISLDQSSASFVKPAFNWIHRDVHMNDPGMILDLFPKRNYISNQKKYSPSNLFFLCARFTNKPYRL